MLNYLLIVNQQLPRNELVVNIYLLCARCY